MRLLRPILDRNSYHTALAKEIDAFLFDLILKPIYEIFQDDLGRENASYNPLLKALRAGTLTYQDGQFRGRFNAQLSRLLQGIGAHYNKSFKSYGLSPDKLPVDVKQAVVEGNQRVKSKAEKVGTFLKAIEGREIPLLNVEVHFGSTLDGLETQFEQTTKTVIPKDLAIPMDERSKEAMKVAYQDNLNLFIKKWHDEEVARLRSIVSRNVQQGLRADSLIKEIQREKRVMLNKARFLARQETSLLVSKYRQERYERAGLGWYMWATSHDGRVRHDHRELNGRYFQYSSPPVTDHDTMARNNPGEDYNCRCVAVPVISDSKERQLNQMKGANL